MKKYTKVFIGVISVVAAVVVGFYVYAGIQVIRVIIPLVEISQAYVYEEQTILSEDGRFLLQTEYFEGQPAPYALFAVIDPASGEVLYQCDDHYRPKEVKSLQWVGNSYDITITCDDVGTITYVFSDQDKTWHKMSPDPHVQSNALR